MRIIKSLLLLGLIPWNIVSGQACYLQQDCGSGQLCTASGTCQPIRSFLDSGSNTVFWVDQVTGHDNNAGTESRPFKSIQRAMKSNTLRPGDAVIIRTGTYYEQINPEVGGIPGKRITITAYPGDEVIVSGATPLAGTWVQDGDAWKLKWPFQALWHRLVANDPFGPARRRDVLIADGEMLQAVYSRADMVEGTFYLEGSPDNPTTMFTKLPKGKNPNSARMETSLLNHLFNPSNNEPSCRFGQVKGYFHLIGITFRHAANDGQMGAVCAGNEGSILENITVEWTNGSGFLISGSNHIVRGVRALHNGMSGIRGVYCDSCLIEYSTSKYNNWKGYRTFWESGGGKWLYTTNSTFRKLDFSENEGPGLWLDMDNFDNVIEQSYFDSNLGANLFLEWTTDRTLVRNNVFTRARYARPPQYGHGVQIHAANDNLVIHNTFLGNEGGGLRIRADDREIATGNRYYNNLFIANSKIVLNSDRRSSELSFEEHRSEADALSNKGEGNVYWYRRYETFEHHTFQFRPKNWTGNAVLRSSSLDAWRAKAFTDYTSSTILLSEPHVVDTTDHVNGWRLAEGSQLIGKAVSLPDDIPALLVDFDGEPRPALNADVGADQFNR